MKRRASRDRFTHYRGTSRGSVDDVITGLALHLHGTTAAAGEEITLTRDIDSVKDKLGSFVLAYNRAIDFIK